MPFAPRRTGARSTAVPWVRGWSVSPDLTRRPPASPSPPRRRGWAGALHRPTVGTGAGVVPLVLRTPADTWPVPTLSTSLQRAVVAVLRSQGIGAPYAYPGIDVPPTSRRPWTAAPWRTGDGPERTSPPCPPRCPPPTRYPRSARSTPTLSRSGATISTTTSGRRPSSRTRRAACCFGAATTRTRRKGRRRCARRRTGPRTGSGIRRRTSGSR